jgi:hypothetical protein
VPDPVENLVGAMWREETARRGAVFSPKPVEELATQKRPLNALSTDERDREINLKNHLD